jgi:hypothetical protein
MQNAFFFFLELHQGRSRFRRILHVVHANIHVMKYYSKNSFLNDYFIFQDRINGSNVFRTPGSDLQHCQEYKDKQLKVDTMEHTRN